MGGLKSFLLLLVGLNATVACETAFDCAYAGECIQGVCECNPHWTGSDCTILRLLPSPSKDAAGLRRENSTSWGGSVIWDSERQRWVMFFADMEQHCGLDTWKRNSRIGMATSASPIGPFTFDDSSSSTSVVQPAWSHNPTVYGPIRTKTTAEGHDPIYLIYHIGNGHASAHGWPRKDCTNGTTPRHRLDALDVPVRTPPFVVPKVVVPDMLVSSSLSGPWKPHRGGLLNSTGWHCNNPAPAFLSNGTVVLVCKLAPRRGPDGKPWRQMAIYVAPGWEGPYEFRRLAPIYGEDAYIWHDPDADSGTGAFHMLYHAMHGGLGKTPTTAWSKDGLEWTPNGFAGPPNPAPRPSYGHSIELVGGDTIQLGRRERHQPIFKDGVLIGLCNGVTMLDDEQDYAFTACVPVATTRASWDVSSE